MEKIFLLVPFILILTFTMPSQAVILFQDNFDNDANWNCSESVPSQWSGAGWTGQSCCYGYIGESVCYETWNSTTHYPGEVSSPGKGGTGKDIKNWFLQVPQAIYVVYSGSQPTATVQMNYAGGGTLTLCAPAGTVVDTITYTMFSSGFYNTLKEVISWINTHSGWSATLNSGLTGSELAYSIRETLGNCGSNPSNNNQCPVSAIGGMYLGWEFPPSFCGNLNYSLPQTSTYRDLYVGWDIKYGSGYEINFDGTQFQKFTRFCPSYSDRTNEIDWGMDALWGWTYGTSYIGFINFANSVWYTTSKTIKGIGLLDGNWHRMVTHAKINDPKTANGAIEFWVDGNNYISVTNIDFGFTGQYFNGLILSPGFGNFAGEYNFPDTNWRAVEWDNYVVATTYQEAAATIPTPPTNLHISPN